MLRVSLSQLTSHPRKFIAVVLAVVIATLFLSATLIADESLKATLRASIGQSYGKSDLVISVDTPKEQKPSEKMSTLSNADVEAIKILPSVESVYALYYVPAVMMTASDNSLSVQIMPAPPTVMSSFHLVEGSMPEEPEQVTITTHVRDRLEVNMHDSLTVVDLNSSGNLGNAAGSGLAQPLLSRKVTVSGIIDSSATPELSLTPTVLADPNLLKTVNSRESSSSLARIQVKLLPGSKPSETQEQIVSALSTKNIIVKNIPDQVSSDLERSLGGAQLVTTFLLVFALISLFVAAIVIYNIFSVLVTGRIRELALLRCIGACRQQIRNSVLTESLILGFISAAVGVVTAMASMLGIISLAKHFPATSLAAFSIPRSAIVVGLLAGTIITVAAAFIPALRANRISPLAALTPEDKNLANTREGKGIFIIGLSAAISGSTLTVWASTTDDLRSYNRIALAAVGGIVSFFGILMCSRLFIPQIIRSIGLITKPCGTAGNLASLNATRNPGRTSATATALLVGVTLVTLMVTGAQGARESMDEYLTNRYPIDVIVSGPTTLQETLTPEMARKLEDQVPEIEAAELVPVVGKYNMSLPSTSTEAMGDKTVQGYLPESYTYAITPEAARRILRQDNIDYGDNDILLPTKVVAEQKVKVVGSSGSVSLDSIQGTSQNLPALITPRTAQKIGGANPQLTDSATPPNSKTELWDNIKEAVNSDNRFLEPEIWISYGESLTEKEKIRADREVVRLLKVQERQVSGVTAQKELFNTLIDVILAIVTALLAVAVLIALIGMANTLSLSVLERTRENSLLRALGLTRNQLRGMLTIESLLIAFVAAFVGIVLGLIYGNLAIEAIFGNHTSSKFIIAWIPTCLVLFIAIVSGLLASLLPARRATRLSPVQGLTLE